MGHSDYTVQGYSRNKAVQRANASVSHNSCLPMQIETNSVIYLKFKKNGSHSTPIVAAVIVHQLFYAALFPSLSCLTFLVLILFWECFGELMRQLCS